MAPEQWAALKPLIEVARKRGEVTVLVLRGGGVVRGQLTAWTEDGRVFIDGRQYGRIIVESLDVRSEMQKRVWGAGARFVTIHHVGGKVHGHPFPYTPDGRVRVSWFGAHGTNGLPTFGEVWIRYEDMLTVSVPN